MNPRMHKVSVFNIHKNQAQYVTQPWLADGSQSASSHDNIGFHVSHSRICSEDSVHIIIICSNLILTYQPSALTARKCKRKHTYAKIKQTYNTKLLFCMLS